MRAEDIARYWDQVRLDNYRRNFEFLETDHAREYITEQIRILEEKLSSGN